MKSELTAHPVELRPEYQSNPTAQALKRIIDACNQHQGGSTVALNSFLMSFYNGGEYAPDMQLLCRNTPKEVFEDVLLVMRGYTRDPMEAHGYFVNGGRLFETIAKRVRKRE